MAEQKQFIAGMLEYLQEVSEEAQTRSLEIRNWATVPVEGEFRVVQKKRRQLRETVDTLGEVFGAAELLHQVVTGQLVLPDGTSFRVSFDDDLNKEEETIGSEATRLTKDEAEYAAYAIEHARSQREKGIDTRQNLVEVARSKLEWLGEIRFYAGAALGVRVEGAVIEQGTEPYDSAIGQSYFDGVAAGVKYVAGLRPAHPLIEKARGEFEDHLTARTFEGVDDSDLLAKARIARRSTSQRPVFVGEQEESGTWYPRPNMKGAASS